MKNCHQEKSWKKYSSTFNLFPPLQFPLPHLEGLQTTTRNWFVHKHNNQDGHRKSWDDQSHAIPSLQQTKFLATHITFLLPLPQARRQALQVHDQLPDTSLDSHSMTDRRHTSLHCKQMWHDLNCLAPTAKIIRKFLTLLIWFNVYWNLNTTHATWTFSTRFEGKVKRKSTIFAE